MAKDFVIVKIDTDRMKDGAELAAELRKGKGGGIPWLVFLDGTGKELINSDGPKGNIGCPVQPHEVEHFLHMLDETRRHMTEEDRAIVEDELRAFATQILEARKRG